MNRLRQWLLGLALLPGLAVAQDGAVDAYSQMLAYLTHSRLDGQVLAGAAGSIKLNLAAGDLNRQSNAHALASGEKALVQLGSARYGHDRVDSQLPLQARAQLGGQVLAGASGLASINQVSGQANDQVNAVAVTTSRQAPLLANPAPALPVPQPPRRPAAAGLRQAMVGADALHGYAGVLQLNQIAGSFNAVENRLGLHVQTGP